MLLFWIIVCLNCIEKLNAYHIFGVIASTIIYGGIMNPASALMWSNTINWKIILSYYVTGLPVDLVRAIATFFFLWLGAEPMLEKLDRIKTKYGLAE